MARAHNGVGEVSPRGFLFPNPSHTKIPKSSCRTIGGSVVVTASQDPDPGIVDLVNESMRLIYASGPTALQFAFQRFRFANTRKRFLLNLTNQANSTHQARSSNAATSNSKLINGVLERQTCPPPGCLHEAIFHRFAPEQICSFPF